MDSHKYIYCDIKRQSKNEIKGEGHLYIYKDLN